ncbi:hypothetical protein CCP1ISM_60018 [Azospirillaceae bacterium]
MELVKITYKTKEGEKIGYFIKVIKGYVPITINSGVFEELNIIEKKPLEINEFSGEVK